MYILVWVDDLIIATNCIDDLNETKNLLSSRFKMTDMGVLKWFLGIYFKMSKGCITMSQEQYLQNVMYRFNMDKCKGVKTPCDKFIESNEDDKLIESKLYRSAVGSLVYAMMATRPDLSWSVSKLSQYLGKPTEAHWIAVKRVFRYINTTITHGLSFMKTDDLKLVGYSDSDWGSSIDRRSTTGYCFMLSVQGGAISWKTRRQPTVALSSTEAEYMALSAATQEALYLKKLVREIDQNLSEHCITIHEDNQGAIALVDNPVHHNRTKHIDIRYHFIREQVQCNCIKIVYLLTNLMIADCLTKPVGRNKLDFCNNVQSI